MITSSVHTDAIHRCVNSISVLICHAGSSDPWHSGHWSLVPHPLPLPLTRTMPPQTINRYVRIAVHTARRRNPTEGRAGITVPPALRGCSRRSLLARDPPIANRPEAEHLLLIVEVPRRRRRRGRPLQRVALPWVVGRSLRSPHADDEVDHSHPH